MRTVIVTGPTGCGKSSHSKEIAALFGIPETNIVDDWQTCRPMRPDHLHLTTEPCDPGKYDRFEVHTFASLGIG